MTSSVLQMGLCAHCASHLPPSEYLKVWFEGMSGGPCLLPVCGAGGRSAHAERADERLCVCVYLSAVFQSEFIRLKAYLTMNSLLKSHSSTCSFLELILAQQELYLKVTAEYWMLSRKVGKIRPEAWSLIEVLLKCHGKLWGEGLELTFLSPPPAGC